MSSHITRQSLKRSLPLNPTPDKSQPTKRKKDVDKASNTKESASSMKKSPTSLKKSLASLKTSPANLKKLPASLKTSPASLKRSLPSLKESPSKIKKTSHNKKEKSSPIRSSPRVAKMNKQRPTPQYSPKKNLASKIKRHKETKTEKPIMKGLLESDRENTPPSNMKGPPDLNEIISLSTKKAKTIKTGPTKNKNDQSPKCINGDLSDKNKKKPETPKKKKPSETTKDPTVTKTKKAPAPKVKNLPVNAQEATEKETKVKPKPIPPNNQPVKKENQPATKKKEQAPKVNKPKLKSPIKKPPKVKTTPVKKQKPILVETEVKTEKKPHIKKDHVTACKVENIYVAEGFRDDCDTFMLKCLNVSKLNFEKFSEIWKVMNFAHIYRGRQSGAEVAELSEEVIHIAKSFMVDRNRSFEENVAGLFLVYAFLNHQPYKKFASLRLVPEDMPAIEALELEARRQRRHDILYILGDVLIRGPCQFHVSARERGLELPLRKYFDGSIQINDSSCRAVGVLSKNCETVALIKDLAVLDDKYSEAKKKLQDFTGIPDPSLNYASLTASELLSSIREIIPGICGERKDSNTDVTEDKVEESHNESRQGLLMSIKEKAMSNVVNPMRHLTGIEERKNDKSLTPPTPNSENSQSKQFSKGKVKWKDNKSKCSAKGINKLFESEIEKGTDSEELMMSPKRTPHKLRGILELTDEQLKVIGGEQSPKRKECPNTDDGPQSKIPRKLGMDVPLLPTPKSPVPETPNTGLHSQTQNQDLICPMADSNCDANDDTSMNSCDGNLYIDIEPQNDVNGNNNGTIENKELTHSETETNTAETIQTMPLEQSETNSQELTLNVEIGSLPLRIYNPDEDGPDIEIEIIDEFKGFNNEIEKRISDEESDIEESTGTLKTKDNTEISANKNKAPVNSSEPSTSQQTVEQLERNRRKEKRELKRRHIKSKFKKLGILSVANFDDMDADDSS